MKYSILMFEHGGGRLMIGTCFATTHYGQVAVCLWTISFSVGQSILGHMRHYITHWLSLFPTGSWTKQWSPKNNQIYTRGAEKGQNIGRRNGLTKVQTTNWLKCLQWVIKLCRYKCQQTLMNWGKTGKKRGSKFLHNNVRE